MLQAWFDWAFGLGFASLGLPQGNMRKWNFRRVSVTAGPTQNCSRRVRLVGAFRRRCPSCRNLFFLVRWPVIFSPANRPSNSSYIVAAGLWANLFVGFDR